MSRPYPKYPHIFTDKVSGDPLDSKVANDLQDSTDHLLRSGIGNGIHAIQNGFDNPIIPLGYMGQTAVSPAITSIYNSDVTISADGLDKIELNLKIRLPDQTANGTALSGQFIQVDIVRLASNYGAAGYTQTVVHVLKNQGTYLVNNGSLPANFIQSSDDGIVTLNIVGALDSGVVNAAKISLCKITFRYDIPEISSQSLTSVNFTSATDPVSGKAYPVAGLIDAQWRIYK